MEEVNKPMLLKKTEDFFAEMEKTVEERKNEIRNAKDHIEVEGQSYYISNAGDDNLDGKTPDTAWQTLNKVSNAELQPGDVVFLRRGDTFRGQIVAKPGVTYAAYGVGSKPNIYGWDKNMAVAECWELVDEKHHIWKCTDKVLDSGTIVFNDGEQHSRKLIPSYINGQFVCRDNPRKSFVIEEEMSQDLDIFFCFTERMTTRESKGESFPVPEVGDQCYGDLYLRCDAGNPGACFDSIELLPHRHLIKVGKCNDVHIDNLCLKYGGGHGIAAVSSVNGLHVTNCEIGWIGGCIQNYLGLDPNYPQGTRGTVTRYGNGVEIYGACDDYEVSNCYIYQVYDAGMTHQITARNKVVEMKNILYKDNLVEYCVYSIEYFLEKEIENESYMSDIEICGNILRFSGYGWGQQRHNVDTPAHIKGWSYVNTARNFTIHHNVFDRAAYRMLHLVAREIESLPILYENIYIQKSGGAIGQYGENLIKEPGIVLCDKKAEEIIRGQWGDIDAKVLYMNPEKRDKES